MSNSILSSLVGKLMRIWDVSFRDCKYLNNEQGHKHDILPKTFT